MTLAYAPSLKNCPIEVSAGYFDPTITAWSETTKSIDNLWLELNLVNSVVVAGSIVASALVTGLNFLVTAPAKLLQVSSVNNLLDVAVKYASYGPEALLQRSRRLNLDALETFVNNERAKIEGMINESNNALSSATPNQLVSSKQVIFDGMSQIMNLPEKFWPEFLGGIYEKNSEMIEYGIREIDKTLKNSEKIAEQAIEYQTYLNHKISKHNNLERKRSNLEKELDDLKIQLKASFNPNNIQNEINRLERKISSISREIDNLLSQNDSNAIFSTFFKNSYLKSAVRENLERRKAFLESIKSQKTDLYIKRSTSWTKTVFKACSVLGIVATGVYVYKNGVPTQDELSKRAHEAYDYVKENVTWDSFSWKNVSTVLSRESKNLSEKINSLWNDLTKDNVIKTLNDLKDNGLKLLNNFKNSLSADNISNAYSETKVKIFQIVNNIWENIPSMNNTAAEPTTGPTTVVNQDLL